MKKIIEGLRRGYARLEPKWRYCAETLWELLALVLLVLAGVLGFVPWLIGRGASRLIRKLREGAAHGPAENADKQDGHTGG